MWKRKSAAQIDPNDPEKEWRLIEKVLVDAFAEQKKSRRWGTVFKTLTFVYLFAFLMIFYTGAKRGGMASPVKEHVGVVRVDGVIAENEPASGGRIGQGLRAAFESAQSKAVILAINSPGGSPVQSGYIYDEMMRLRGEYPDKKLYAVIADLGASGGYYVASAADQIFADKASLVGSIGVTASGFGFVEAIDKLGVERRHFTAGDHKAFLDPFMPVKEEEREFWQGVLNATHNQFVQAVKDGRGERLKLTDDITSGLIWSGEQALALGLIDGLGSVRSVARDQVGVDELHDYTPRTSPLKALMGEFGVSVGRGIAHSLQMAGGIQLR